MSAVCPRSVRPAIRLVWEIIVVERGQSAGQSCGLPAGQILKSPNYSGLVFGLWLGFYLLSRFLVNEPPCAAVRYVQRVALVVGLSFVCEGLERGYFHACSARLTVTVNGAVLPSATSGRPVSFSSLKSSEKKLNPPLADNVAFAM